MTKKSFLLKLLPPRPDFAFTLTDQERNLMQQHAAHWMKALESGIVIAFGPVGDPAGPYGVGIATADDESEIEQFQKSDPAIQAGVGFKYERFPMLKLVTR